MRRRMMLFCFLVLAVPPSFGSGDHDTLMEPNSQSCRSWKLLDPLPSPSKDRIVLLIGGMSGLYTGAMVSLYSQWYTGYPSSAFHFFDDSKEWEGMDKFGHAWDAYSIAKPVSRCFRWTGHDARRSAYDGVAVALLFQSTVEVFDGFSQGWGFSGYDMAANVLGSGFFLGQELAWKEQRIVLKYSFHTTRYAAYRPDVLGSTMPERILKDYNGITYWASIHPASFLHGTIADRLPEWFSIAVGFGAEGMLGGEHNPPVVDGKQLPSFERYKQYYLGLDIDLARVKTRNRLLSAVFKTINILHLPAPAIEFSPGRRTRWHAFYF